MRILITGSRTWTDKDAILQALRKHNPRVNDEPTVVHGDCPTGADALAQELADEFRVRTERYPAKWREHSENCPDWHFPLPTCKMAGFRRNAEMVSLGADICLAFQKDRSPGTQSTIQLAQAAGIPTFVYTEGDIDASGSHTTS